MFHILIHYLGGGRELGNIDGIPKVGIEGLAVESEPLGRKLHEFATSMRFKKDYQSMAE